MRRIRRSQIATADYNPRIISPAEKSALRKGMRKFGLLQPLVWNERTGTLVGGHQRLAEIDRQSSTPDFEIEVACVDLGDKEEREANILLNNFGAQGDWDLEKLKELARVPGFDPEAAGFEAVDLYRLLGEDEFAQVATAEQAQKVAEVFDNAVKGREKRTSKNKEERSNDPHFFLVVVFPNTAERTAYLARRGLSDERYHSARELLGWEGVEAGAETTPPT
jgi:ParB-like chromosome segregation protein Spo0J